MALVLVPDGAPITVRDSNQVTHEFTPKNDIVECSDEQAAMLVRIDPGLRVITDDEAKEHRAELRKERASDTPSSQTSPRGAAATA